MKRRAPQSGSALLTVLGIVALLGVLVFAYAFSARVERIAAHSASDSAIACEHIDSLVSMIMSVEIPIHLLSIRGDESGIGSIQPFSGRIDFSKGRQSSGLDINHVMFSENHFSRHAFTSHDADPYRPCPYFLNNASTNFIPAALHSEIVSLEADWLPIATVDERGGDDENIVYTNVIYAYAVVDLSGYLDATEASSNEVAYLGKKGVDVESVGDFLNDRAFALSPKDEALKGWTSLLDMSLRNRGLARPATELMHLSYDPGPDVTITNGEVYSDLSNPNRDARLTPKLDMNAWTNGFSGNLSSTRDLEAHYRTEQFLEWLADATNRLAFCGFARPESIAWGLVNFLDGDRVPQSTSPAPWRDDWPQEDVPLVNEIALAQVPTSFGFTNCYAAAVELWYPFAPNPITPHDDAQLVVAVYTNWQALVASHANRPWHLDSSWTNDIILLGNDSEYGFTMTNHIEHMEYGTTREFAVFTSRPEEYISFPVAVTDFSGIGEEVARVNKEPGSDLWRTVNYGTNTLFRRSENLPIGIQNYHTYVEIETNRWARREITVTNDVRLIIRVRIGDHWVDEAMAYDPDPESPYHVEPYRYLAPIGWQVDDPRQNGRRDSWQPYEGVQFTADGDALCTLSGTTNTICNPYSTYGQGLPVVHYDSPARRAGDIGYIYQPYAYTSTMEGDYYGYYGDDPTDDGTGSFATNLWQSICLADNRHGAARSHFAYTPGSALEFFTARAATNTPVRGLVSAWTDRTNVVAALVAGAEIGVAPGIIPSRLPDAAIDWMTETFVEAQGAMYDGDSRPIGVGDFCMALGMIDGYKDIPARFAAEEDPLHWLGSLGNDLKEDIVRELCERLSFRQQIFAIVLDVRVMSPAMTLRAERRAVVIVVRDAYTGAWRVVEKHAL